MRSAGSALAAALVACAGAAPPAVDAPPPVPISPANVQRPPAPSPGPRASVEGSPQAGSAEPAQSSGELLGRFRNTYYNFPSQRDHSGPPVTVFDARCRPLASVPMPFHDTLCVQGSGSLATGQTVSFARRRCACARTCPRTGQKICFEALDPRRYPWGRGAAGTAIVPLRTVAVDSSVIPLRSSIFIPEYVGLPLDASGSSTHDGCFVAEDRGIRVLGQHVDIFTGAVALTRLWNDLVPSNHGVTVYADSPRCGAPAH